MGCTDVLLNISLHSEQESYVIQLDFSAAFDRVNHSGLMLKLKPVGVGALLYCHVRLPGLFLRSYIGRGSWL